MWVGAYFMHFGVDYGTRANWDFNEFNEFKFFGTNISTSDLYESAIFMHIGLGSQAGISLAIPYASGVGTRRARPSALAQARHRYAAERNGEKGTNYARIGGFMNNPQGLTRTLHSLYNYMTKC